VKVLFLEDDAETAQAICKGLRERGYAVEHAGDVPSAKALLAAYRFDAAILDLMVPGGSGYEVLAELRARGRDVPCLILTARDAVDERVEGLERGADDYLVKPFAFAELLARLRALLRRPTRRIEPLRVQGLEIDPIHRQTSFGQRRVDLTRTEFDLLFSLAERRGEVINRLLLLELVWGYRFDPGTNVVDVHVNRLRRKLESAGVPGVVRTVRGVGYVID
jgi:DNA-binding response OmpR family regulator